MRNRITKPSDVDGIAEVASKLRDINSETIDPANAWAIIHEVFSGRPYPNDVLEQVRTRFLEQ